jgi:hypothetical protein
MHLYYSFLQLGKLKNIYQSWYELMKTGMQKPNIEEEYMMFFYKLYIENIMRENETSGSDGAGT